MIFSPSWYSIRSVSSTRFQLASYSGYCAGFTSRVDVRRARCTTIGMWSSHGASANEALPGRVRSSTAKVAIVGSRVIFRACISFTMRLTGALVRSSPAIRSPSAVKRKGVRVSSLSGSMMKLSTSWLMWLISS